MTIRSYNLKKTCIDKFTIFLFRLEANIMKDRVFSLGGIQIQPSL